MNYFLSLRGNSVKFYRVFLICSLILFANFFHSFSQTEIVKWDFDDGDFNLINSPPNPWSVPRQTTPRQTTFRMEIEKEVINAILISNLQHEIHSE